MSQSSETPVDAAVGPGEAAAGGGLGAAKANLTSAWRNPDVRLVQLSYLGSEIAKWSYVLALLIWAYDVGGAALVGAWAGVRLLFGALSGPIGGAIADRGSRRTFLVVSNAIRIPLVAFTAVMIFFDVGIWAVLIPGTLLTMLGVTFRPAQAALLPTLVEEPRELTAANATAETIEGTVALVGPALGGLLVAAFGPAIAVLLSTLGSVWSVLLLLRVASDRRRVTADVSTDSAGNDVDAEPASAEQMPPASVEPGIVAELAGGFRAIFADPHMRVLTGLTIVDGIVGGIFMVAILVVAAEWLGDPAAMGWLFSLSGGAAIVGGVVVLGAADRLPLARLSLIGLIAGGVAFLSMGLAPHGVVIVLMMIVIGFIEPATYIAFGTIPQRLVPDRLMARAFSAMGSVEVASMALGSFFAPILIDRFGLRWTMILLGTVGIGLFLLLGIPIRGLDDRLAAPRGLDLLKAVPLFAPISGVLLEQIVHRLEPVDVEPGAVIVREGETSDRFYVIESGQVLVTEGGDVLRTEGPGEVFGEIGLLRDVPRTATVTAQTAVTLLALSREEFLAAMAGTAQIRGIADELVRSRLAR